MMSLGSGRRTATTTAATHGWSSATRAIELAARHGDRADRGDAAYEERRTRAAGLARPPRWSTRRREAHGTGWLPGAAQLLDRFRSSRPLPDPHRRADRGW